ncbi:MAG TPA: LysR family transcriptional regulator [Sphingobium sp.]
MSRILMERSGEMEVFARVVQEGSFSRAARTLGLTPSAVSKLIGRMEARLGARLLMRTTRAVTLTDEGEGYYAAALSIVKALDDADHAVGGGMVRGRLTISASLPFGSLYVAPAITAFLARHPDVRIDLHLTDDVIDLLAERTDIAIRTGNLPDSALVARRLGRSRMTVCAAPAYLDRHGVPQTPADLARHDCLTFTFRPSPALWPFRVEGEVQHQPVSGSVQVNNGTTLREMAVMGAGIARMGLFNAEEEMAAGRLVPVLEAHNPGDIETIHALYVGGGQVPHRVRAFIDFLADRLKSEPGLQGL